MEELHEMVKQLREKLKSKNKSMKDSINNHSLLEHRENAIDLFEKSIEDVEKHPFYKNEVLRNYRKEFKQIMKDIDQIEDSKAE
ncbi:MAG: hypothetical protein R8G66_01345 [Cytophagales bacterium]|nr:hypothetical protein [Cytophagales bacterium]